MLSTVFFTQHAKHWYNFADYPHTFKKAMGILLTPSSVGLTIPPNIQGLGVILDIIMRYFEVYSI